MATITYELGKPKQDKTRKVSIILSHKGQRKRIPTNITLTEADLSRSGKIKSRNIQKVIENKINLLKDRLYSLEADITSRDVDAEWIHSHIANSHAVMDFFEYTKHWIEKSTNRGKGNYAVMLNSLRRFYQKDKLPFSSIDYKFLNDYKEWQGIATSSHSVLLE